MERFHDFKYSSIVLCAGAAPDAAASSKSFMSSNICPRPVLYNSFTNTMPSTTLTVSLATKRNRQQEGT